MKNLYKSLANFQQEVPTIHKATQGFGYTYADLTAIYKVINPLMKKNGLGFTQLLQNNQMVTIVFHIESGETIESRTDIPMNVQLKGMNDFQVMGSAISYLRRYCISSILGLVTDKDTDAGGEQVSKPVIAEKEVLSNDRFDKAVEKIRNKQYTIDELKAKFKLNTAQEGALLLINL
jgi:hypothetical protein